MNRSVRDYKVCAKRALKGKFLTSMLAMIATGGITLLGSSFAGSLFQGNSVMSIVLSQIALFIFYLIMNLFVAGLDYLNLNIVRGREYSFGDLLYFFKHQPDRVIIAGFVLALIELISFIPYYYVNYAVDPGTTLESQSSWILLCSYMMLLAVVLNALLSLPFCQVFYLQADDDDLGGIAALKESARLMKGKMLKRIWLEITFLPLVFLSIFTLYIGLLWVLPYRYATLAEFYLDIRGELDSQFPEPEPQNMELPNRIEEPEETES